MSRRRDSRDKAKRQSKVLSPAAILALRIQKAQDFEEKRRGKKLPEASKSPILSASSSYRVLTISSNTDTFQATALFQSKLGKWKCISADHPSLDWLTRIRNFDTLQFDIQKWIRKHNFSHSWGPSLSQSPAPSKNTAPDCTNTPASVSWAEEYTPNQASHSSECNTVSLNTTSQSLRSSPNKCSTTQAPTRSGMDSQTHRLIAPNDGGTPKLSPVQFKE